MFNNFFCALFLTLLGASIALFGIPHFEIPKGLHVKSYPGNCNPPEDSKTKTCLDAYFKTYGFDTSEHLPSFYEYQQRHASVISQYGDAGLDVSCEFETTLETCLGPLMNSACMNPATFERIYNAAGNHVMINYAISFADCEYECHNKDLTKSAMACVNNIGLADIQNISSNCTAHAQMVHENGEDFCEAVDNLITCYEDSYVKYCGEGLRS